MRFYISRAALYKRYKEIDRIHDPKVYDLDPEDNDYIEVETYQQRFEREQALIPTIQKPIFDWQPPFMHNHQLAALKTKIQSSQREIHAQAVATNSTINHRTQAHNRKCAETTIDEQRVARADPVAAQIFSTVHKIYYYNRTCNYPIKTICYSV